MWRIMYSQEHFLLRKIRSNQKEEIMGFCFSGTMYSKFFKVS